MTDTLLTIQKQIVAKSQGTEGTFDTGVLSATYAKLLPHRLSLPNYNLQQNKRDPMRSNLSRPRNVAGSNFASFSFDVEARGSGTAGVAPAVGLYLKACGMTETINTGSEAVGSAVASPRNTGVSPSPVLAVGTLAAKSGIITVEMVSNAITNPAGAVFRATLRYGDGTEPSTWTWTVSDSAFSTVALSFVDGTALTGTCTLTVTDPDLNGVGDPVSTWKVGDEWSFTYASASQAEVEYSCGNTATQLSMATYNSGVVHKYHSCLGSFSFKGLRGTVPVFTFNMMGCRVTSSGIADASMLSSIAYEDVVPEAFQGITFTDRGAAVPCFVGFELNRGARIEMLEDNSKSTGYLAARFVGEDGVTGKIDPIAQLVATYNPYTTLFSGATGTGVALTHGSTSGNIVQVACNLTQTTNLTHGDRNGHTTTQMDLLFPSPEYDAGGDYSPFSIIFK